MTFDQLLSGVAYLIAVVILFFIGKFIFDRWRPGFDLNRELFGRDNLALALSVTGYYGGLVAVIGGALVGPSEGLWLDLFDLFFFGIIGILLLNISGWINDKLILRTFDNEKEIIDDQNAGTGIIEGANFVAVGLITAGAVSGQGDLITAAVFWLLGQATLVAASYLYDWLTPFDLHEEVMRDNVAVGVAFAGVLIGLGNIIRIGIAGDFVSWQINLYEYVWFVGAGLILLPFVRWITDRVLVPGVRLTDELVHQQNPNIGAGALEGFAYVAASFLMGWAF
jgi:uncharacterized membrane protein YjfL (UPF0719 family)